jgi:thioredoxin-dependent peroxiredoxin
MLNIGEPFPQFELPAHDGRLIRQVDYAGKQPVVLFFYPRASTPGCTKESQMFTELYPQFTAAGAEVFGASADSAHAQASFCEKYNLRVGGLLTDKDWKLLTELGMPFDGEQPVKRQTFLIATDGTLAWRYHYTGAGDSTSHARQALAAVHALAETTAQVD